MDDPSGRVAVVTGGGSGIGIGIALRALVERRFRAMLDDFDFAAAG